MYDNCVSYLLLNIIKKCIFVFFNDKKKDLFSYSWIPEEFLYEESHIRHSLAFTHKVFNITMETDFLMQPLQLRNNGSASIHWVSNSFLHHVM